MKELCVGFVFALTYMWWWWDAWPTYFESYYNGRP